MTLFRDHYADGERLEIGGVLVRLRVSRRARRISLRIDRARREAVAVAPSLRRLPEAAAFAKQRQGWVAERLAQIPAVRAVEAGESLMLFGAPCRLAPDGRRPRLVPAVGDSPRTLAGCGVGAVDPQLVARMIKREALRVFGARAAAHCAVLTMTAPPILVMDARTRWGSCTPARPGRGAAIRLSWRLALAPFEVADYVVAHECAHLIEANHAARFWTLVRTLVGDEKPHRAWLRAHGAKLHAYDL